MKKILAAIVMVAAAAAPAWAQARPTSMKFTASVFGFFEIEQLAAKQTFDATLGTHTLKAPGGGIDVFVGKNWFARFNGTRSTKDGQRVLVFNGTVFPLGITLTAERTPLEFGGGFRYPNASRITPYVGATYVSMGYKETYQFAESGQNVDERHNGFGVFGGADVALTRQLFVGAEGSLRRVKFTPGDNSAAKAFAEDDLGGMSVRVKFGVRF